MKKFNKILIVHTAFLGDVILTTPLIRETQRLFPSAIIDVLVTPQTRDALLNNPHIRKIITFDKRNNKLKAFIQTIKTLRNQKYDLAILPHSSITTIYLMLLSGIKQRIGFDRGHAALYLTSKTAYINKQNWHVTQKNLNLLRVFSHEEFNFQTEIYPSEPDYTKATLFLSKIAQNDRPVIIIAPGSVHNTKKWPEKHYIELTKMLGNSNYNLLFIGSTTEFDLCRNIIEQAGSKALNLAGKTSILESAAIIQKANLMVCNDSGALHIANAVQTDVFAFFGPTVSAFGFYPFREKDKIFEVNMSCRPCGNHGGKKCPLSHHRCMQDIHPRHVFNQIQKKIKESESEKIAKYPLPCPQEKFHYHRLRNTDATSNRKFTLCETDI